MVFAAYHYNPETASFPYQSVLNFRCDFGIWWVLGFRGLHWFLGVFL